MQKEGVDGIITEACFIIHPKPKYSRVMVLEFFGRSMHPAAVVVRELVALRNRIRQEGDYAHLSAMEEFNAKYVQAIEYKRKSEKYEGSPISVIILQVDGDDPYLLDKCVADIVGVVEQQDNVDIIVAADDKEGERFWEDRHRLSAIAKRTSGFKMNEDVVIPMTLVYLWVLCRLWTAPAAQARSARRHAVIVGVLTVGVFEHSALAALTASTVAVLLALADRFAARETEPDAAQTARMRLRHMCVVWLWIFGALLFSFLAPGNQMRRATRHIDTATQLRQLAAAFDEWRHDKALAHPFQLGVKPIFSTACHATPQKNLYHSA